MDDVNAFLNWYLSPTSRVGRKVFNTVLFLAFTPFMLLIFADVLNFAKDNASLLQDPLALANGKGLVIRDGFPWGAFLQQLVFLGLVPLFQMRARDASYPEGMGYVVAVCVAVQMLELLFHISLGWAVDVPLGIVFFGVTTVLCFAPSRYIPVSQRQNYDKKDEQE